MEYKFTFNDAIDLADQKCDLPGWSGHACEVIGNGYIVTGNIDNEHLDPRFCISDDDLLKAAKSYEEDSGQCWNCKGLGKVFAGWHYKTGTEFKTCARCNGDGKAAA